MCDEGLHDPFTDQVECARYRAERDMLAQAMERVADDIERTFLGFEGAEDAPAMRWAREFRAALGSLHAATSPTSRGDASDVTMSAHDLLPQDEREAIAWVREHGGLDEVNRKVAESMQQAEEYIALRCSLAERAGDLYEMLDKEDDELVALLDKRLMPEGMEWPRYEDGEPVRIGDEFAERIYGNPCKVGHFAINKHAFLIFDEEDVNDCEAIDHGTHKRVKRPAPKVLDADGAEIRVGDTVWRADNGKEYWVRKGHQMTADAVVIGLKTNNDCADETVDASVLTHRAPVLAADGKPLEAGQTVWDTNGDELVIGALEDGGHTVACRYADFGDGIPTHGIWSPSDLTHRAPVIAADGEPLEVGQTVWSVLSGAELTVQSINCGAPDSTHIVACDNDAYYAPSQLTHQRPVLDADGVPIHEGDEVRAIWNLTGYSYVVEDASNPLEIAIRAKGYHDQRTALRAKSLTHTKPEHPDSWERLEDDAGKNPFDYCKDAGHRLDTCENSETYKARDIVRRAKALAERGEL